MAKRKTRIQRASWNSPEGEEEFAFLLDVNQPQLAKKFAPFPQVEAEGVIFVFASTKKGRVVTREIPYKVQFDSSDDRGVFWSNYNEVIRDELEEVTFDVEYESVSITVFRLEASRVRPVKVKRRLPPRDSKGRFRKRKKPKRKPRRKSKR